MSNNERHSDDGAHLPSALGGAKFNALDPNDPKDQALVRSAMKRWPKRWRGLDDAKKEKFVEGLEEAHDTAREIMRGSVDSKDRLDAAGLVLSAIKTAAMIEAQNQADEHLEDKNARLDAGAVTDRVETPIKFIKGIDGDAL